MSTTTNIQWTEKTWNPTTGCDKVSPGCKHCYAETMAARLKGMNNRRYANGFKFTCHPDKFRDTLKVKTPSLYFVNSMSDLFHKEMPLETLQTIFETMNEADWHVYQILTKRGDRLAEFGPHLPWADHIWMGVSVESALPYNSRGDRPTDRIEQLRRSGARTKFLSLEPLLGPLPELDLEGIDWVIVGGESGNGARPMNIEWARDIVDQCRRAGTAVFVKQLGRVWAQASGSSDKKGGTMEDWPEDLRIREMPTALAAHRLVAAERVKRWRAADRHAHMAR